MNLRILVCGIGVVVMESFLVDVVIEKVVVVVRVVNDFLRFMRGFFV